MIGKLLSKTIKVATCPLDMCDAALDLITGGDGKKAGREELKENFPTPSKVRDALCDVLEDLDA